MFVENSLSRKGSSEQSSRKTSDHSVTSRKGSTEHSFSRKGSNDHRLEHSLSRGEISPSRGCRFEEKGASKPYNEIDFNNAVVNALNTQSMDSVVPPILASISSYSITGPFSATLSAAAPNLLLSAPLLRQLAPPSPTSSVSPHSTSHSSPSSSIATSTSNSIKTSFQKKISTSSSSCKFLGRINQSDTIPIYDPDNIRFLSCKEGNFSPFNLHASSDSNENENEDFEKGEHEIPRLGLIREESCRSRPGTLAKIDPKSFAKKTKVTLTKDQIR